MRLQRALETKRSIVFHANATPSRVVLGDAPLTLQGVAFAALTGARFFADAPRIPELRVAHDGKCCIPTPGGLPLWYHSDCWHRLLTTHTRDYPLLMFKG